MIATRLSSVGQVAGVAVAALLCYLVSQSVATERAALAKVDRQIAAEQDAIGKLGTEIATRSRLTQIENWNRQLALQAPRPSQYVENGVQLASLYAHDPHPQLQLDPMIAPPHGAIEQVSAPAIPAAPLARPAIGAASPATVAPATVPPVPARVVPAIGRPPVPAARPAPRSPIEMVAFRPAASAASPKRTPPPADLLPESLLRSAAFVRPRSNRLDAEAAAVEPVALRSSSSSSGGGLLSADIAGLAKAEQAKRRTGEGK